MDPRGERRTALVTGASRGIGRGIAVSLAADGYAVGIHYDTNEVAAHEAEALVEAAGGSAVTLQADMADGDAVKAMVDEALAELDHLDVVVLNAGICPFMPFLELTEEIFELPARIGAPQQLTGQIDDIDHPMFATAVGLVLIGATSGPEIHHRSESFVDKLSSKFKNLVAETFLNW